MADIDSNLFVLCFFFFSPFWPGKKERLKSDPAPISIYSEAFSVTTFAWNELSNR